MAVAILKAFNFNCHIIKNYNNFQEYCLSLYDYIIKCGDKLGGIEKMKPDGTMQSRGAISPSSPRLVQMFEMADIRMKDFDFKLNFGLIASGSKLLDNKDEVEILRKLQPEIIGGDMESAGMASVCLREKIDCIMVKGICDWGYNKNNRKDKYQNIAMKNSIEAISLVLTNFVDFQIP